MKPIAIDRTKLNRYHVKSPTGLFLSRRRFLCCDLLNQPLQSNHSDEPHLGLLANGPVRWVVWIPLHQLPVSDTGINLLTLVTMYTVLPTFAPNEHDPSCLDSPRPYPHRGHHPHATATL